MRSLLCASLLGVLLCCSLESPPEPTGGTREMEPPPRAESKSSAPMDVQEDSPEPALRRDQLFDIGESRPTVGLDLEKIAREGSAPPADLREPSSLLRARARYRHQSDEFGPEGPNRPQVGVAEGGIAIPVGSDDSVQLRSGIRVDYEKDRTGALHDAATSPTVGIEVRF